MNGLSSAEKALSALLRTASPAERPQIYLATCPEGECTAKAYNGFCLIIGDNGDCVTIYRLPEWFGKKRYYDGKKTVRNAKRYALPHSYLYA